jgi:uncharacterized FAD-dependent dehydrogenase
MIRLSELKMPLDGVFNPPDKVSSPPLYPPTLAPLIAHTLGVSMDAIADWKVFKRSFDARQKLQVVYIVDVQLHDSNKEQQLLQQHAQHPHIQATPDMQWHPPVHAPADWARLGAVRPVVVGFGP